MNKKIKENFHLAIIPDGNRRWAKLHNKSIREGHWTGIQKLRDVAEWCKELGVKYLSLWIFSTENAMRSKKEVKTLFSLFEKMISEVEKKLNSKEMKDVKFRFVGKLEMFPKKLIKKIRAIEEKTKNGTMNLILLMGYGGRQEIVDAVNKIINDIKKKKVEKVDEKLFSRYLYAPDIPDPDLIIRTSEQRLSGLYPWQGVYSEIYFCPKLWPDFEKEDLLKGIKFYLSRERRFGR